MNEDTNEKNDHNRLVVNRYDTEEATQFYRIVMGDGGYHIHYGIFKAPNDTTLQAAANTVSVLMSLAKSGGANFGANCHVLDMGAGNGGSAHKIAQETGSRVTCVNLCENQNAINKARVKELNLEDRIDVITADMENLPHGWGQTFDVIWSIDAYFHATDKFKLLSECYRVLKPGGVIAFSDIVASTTATGENLASFKHRFHLDDFDTQQLFEELLQRCGFTIRKTKDLTCYLIPNYRRMISRSFSLKSRLDKVSDRFIEEYTSSLQKDIQVLKTAEAQEWVAFIASKPNGEVAKRQLLASTCFVSEGNPAGVIKRYITCKLHNLVVSDKSVRYHGSIGVSRTLLEAGGIEEYEAVDVVNLRTGARWTTYVVALCEEGKFTLNGGGSRLGEVGDECVILTYGLSARFVPARVVYCDGSVQNKIEKIFTYEQGTVTFPASGANFDPVVVFGNGFQRVCAMVQRCLSRETNSLSAEADLVMKSEPQTRSRGKDISHGNIHCSLGIILTMIKSLLIKAELYFCSGYARNAFTTALMPIPANMPPASLATISFTALSSSDASVASAELQRLLTICETDGFFYLSHHEIPVVLLRRAVTASRKFFQLPEETKLRFDNNCHPILPARCRGYMPFGAEMLNGEHQDHKQLFDLGIARPMVPGKRYTGPNVLPGDDIAPDFAKSLLELQHKVMKSLVPALHRSLARALDLDPCFFDSYMNNPNLIQRALYYPPRVGSAGKHTDSGLFTVLIQEPSEESSLQVYTRGKWVSAEACEELLIINLGDSLQYWTKGRFISTPHQVVHRSPQSRVALAFFCYPDVETEFLPLGETDPKKKIKALDIVDNNYESIWVKKAGAGRSIELD